MPNQLVILPILLPFAAGVANLLVHNQRRAQAAINLAALFLTLLSALWIAASTYAGPDVAGRVMTSQMGNWPAPFGITVACDLFSAMLLCVSAVVAMGVYLYVLSQTPLRFAGGYFHAVFPLLLLGVNWAFVAGDLFNLFVAFEVMLLASYTLLIVGTTARQMRQAYKYVLLNLVVSAVFVASCGWLYGKLGTLNFAELAVLSREGHVDARAAVGVAALAFVFATKAAAFPLWFWLPDTYPTLPPALGGMYAGLLTKVGVYALVRLLLMVFGSSAVVLDALTPLILASAAGTMFLGVLGAVSSRTVRRILSIHVISQVGYMVLGIGLAMAALRATGGRLDARDLAVVAVAGVLLYMIQHMIVKCSLFLCCGLMEKYGGTDDLDGFGALLERDRWLATIFLIAALSLVGLPPLSGFFGKFVLIRGSFQQGGWDGVTLGIVAAATGALTLLSMAKIWSYGFWSAAPKGSKTDLSPPDFRPPRRVSGLLPVTGLVVAALAVGLGAGFFFDVARGAAHGIVDSTNYVDAVLGGSVAPELRTLGDAPVLLDTPVLLDAEGGR